MPTTVPGAKGAQDPNIFINYKSRGKLKEGIPWRSALPLQEAWLRSLVVRELRSRKTPGVAKKRKGQVFNNCFLNKCLAALAMYTNKLVISILC